MRRFEESGGLEGDKKLGEWGYPRHVGWDERNRAEWYRYGPDCIVWLDPVEGEQSTRIFHIAVAPGTQKAHGIAPRALFQGLDVLAGLLECDRLIANDCTESGEVTDYLKRLGWTPCTMETIEGDWYEKRFTDGDEDSHEQAPETQDRPTV